MIIWGLRFIGWVAGSPWTAALAAALVATGIGWHVLDKRADRLAQIERAVLIERNLWQQEREKEAARQQEINAEAVRLARAEVSRLEAENAALAALAKEWDHAADAEPTARDVCLSDDSRMRLNKAR